METLTVQTFKTKIFNFDAGRNWKFEGSIPAIINFYADGCGPCRTQSSALEDIAAEFAVKVSVFTIDIEATPELSTILRVREIPALLFIPKAGKPALFSGLTSQQIIREAIRNQFGVEGERAEVEPEDEGCCPF